MKKFNYTTQRGTEVELTIVSSDDILAKIKGKGEFKAFGNSFNFDRECNNQPAIKIDFKVNGKNIYLQITDEIYRYIKKVKEDERIEKLPKKEKLKAKIKKIKKTLQLTYKVDTDMCTGISYYAISTRVEKDIWGKIAEYFEYINTSHHDDNFDAIYNNNFKGYLTRYPDKVEKILINELNLSENKKELASLENKYKKIIEKESNDKKYRKELIEKELNCVIREFPDFKEGLKKINLGNGEHKELKETDNNAYNILDLIIGDFDKSAKSRTYDPNKIKKVKSSVYAGGYIYYEKDNIAVIPTEKHTVVMSKNTYSKEWWNSWSGVSINGFFAPYGLGDITIYPKKDGILQILEKFGYISKNYYEVSNWFLCTQNFTNWRDDILNIVTLSDDYNYMETQEEVLELYKNEKRWEWSKDDSRFKKMPTIEHIKYVGKFEKLD